MADDRQPARVLPFLFRRRPAATPTSAPPAPPSGGLRIDVTVNVTKPPQDDD